MAARAALAEPGRARSRAGRPSPAPGRGQPARRPAPDKRAPSGERRAVTVVGSLVWGGALFGSVAVGAPATAVVVIPVAVVAALSAVRAAGRAGSAGQRSGVPTFAAVTVGFVLPVAAIGGPVSLLAVGAALAVAVAAVLVMSLPRRAGALLVAVFAPAVAGGSVVAATVQGQNLGLTLVAAVCLYDLACWVNGSGRGAGGPVGIGAGVLSLAVLAVFVAAVLVPPFSGSRPWVMLGLVAVLSPLGVVLAASLAARLSGGPGRRRRQRSGRSGRRGGRSARAARGAQVAAARLPALRRIDSLILAGPAWVAAAALVLHR